MSTRDVIYTALVAYIQRTEDRDASEVLKVFEEIEHVLLADRIDYGAEDVYTVKIIYRSSGTDVGTFYYNGTFGQLIREIIEYEERQK